MHFFTYIARHLDVKAAFYFVEGRRTFTNVCYTGPVMAAVGSASSDENTADESGEAFSALVAGKSICRFGTPHHPTRILNSFLLGR